MDFKKIIIALLLASIVLATNNCCYSQTTTTITSKRCEKCGKGVSINSKVGDKCPHCGVIWGSENTHTSTSHRKYYSSPSYNPYKISTSSIPKKRTGQKIKKAVTEVDNSTATKLDTESWILEKLTTYTPKKYFDKATIEGYEAVTISSGWYNMNYKYSFDSYNIIITHEMERDQQTTNYKTVIPIYDIDRVYDYKGAFWITTKKETIIEYNETDNTKRVNNVFTTNFDIHSETELTNRLHKAFLHLKKFYKKPVSTELF